MQITFDDKHARVRDRLRERLERVGELRCADHQQAVIGVIINARENGWFDSRWTTCCEKLEREATKILGSRCG